MFVINTFLGFLIAQLYDLLKRDRESKNSPKKLNMSFYLKDTWRKILLALLLSFAITLALHFNYEDALKLFGSKMEAINDLIYLPIGAAPELILQRLKKRAGFLQPKEVEGYKRN